MNGAYLNMRILLIDNSQDVVEALTFWLENEGALVDSYDDSMKVWDFDRSHFLGDCYARIYWFRTDRLYDKRIF